MPRVKRALRDKQVGRKGKAPAISSTAPEILTEAMPWATREELRAHCPLCNMMVGKMQNFLDGPYEFKIMLQQFGGSMKSPTGKMAQRPGYMSYVDVTDSHLAEWAPIVVEKLRAALDQLESAEVPEPKKSKRKRR